MNSGGESHRSTWFGSVTQIGLLALLIALFITYVPVLVDLMVNGEVYENQGITDLGRDLLGASVIEQGGNPFQQLGDLISQHGMPDLPLSGAPKQTGWVVHPPLALGVARGLNSLFGADAEIVGRWIGGLSVVALAIATIVLVRRGKPTWALPAGVTTLVWVPTFTDTVWIQWNALAGLGLLGVVLLDRRGRWLAARILLGLLVAWKPWLAVFALALPRSSSALKDLLVVAATATAATLAAAPFVGGLGSLWGWISEAMPGNAVEARKTPSNISWTSFAGPGFATAVYVGAVVTLPFLRRWLSREYWLLAPVWIATALAPFVWDHYWLALAPAIWLVATQSHVDLRLPVLGWAGLATLPVLLARLGQPGLELRVVIMVVAGAVLWLGTAMIGGRGLLRSEPRQTS